jgi:putative photosynthetic complex assembly protein 2
MADLLPLVFAVMVWWIGTGVVMLLDGFPQRTYRWSLVVATVVAIAALICITRSADNTSVAAAYGAFVCAVLVWAWHELTFLTGWLTGPRKDGCSEPTHGPTRFHEAVQTILWHELAIIAAGLVIAALTWGGRNQVATWTFALLWVMRLSAKLNLFLGVRNRGEEFLPPHLLYLGSYFKRRSINPLLPVSLLVGTVFTAGLVAHALQMQGAERVGLLLVSAMLTLAVLEHVLMITPLPPSWLWRWAMRTREVGTP